MASQGTNLEWAVIVVTKHKLVKVTVSTVLVTSIPSHWSDISYYGITYHHSTQDIATHCSDWVTTDYSLGIFRLVRFY